MAFITAETRSDLIALSVGMLKQAPSNALLEELIALSVDGGTLADAADHIAKTAAFKAEYPSFQTAAQYAAEIFDNITAGGTVTAEIRTAVIDLATAYLTTGMSKAGLALEIVQYLTQPSALLNSDFADIAQSVQNRSAAAEYFVVTKELGGSTDAELAAAVASVTSDAATLTAANAAADATADAEEVVPGQTFTLTTNLNTVTGGAGDDTISGGTGTIDSDSITGGEGSDTLSVTLSNADDNNAAFTMSGVETFQARTTGAVTLDMGSVSGVETYVANRLAGNLTLNDVQDIANIQIDRNTGNADIDVNYEATVSSGASDSITITVDNSSDVGTVNVDGVETVNLVSNNNPLNDTNEIQIDAAGTGTATEVLNISGAGDLTVAATDALTINNSASGDVALTPTAATAINHSGSGSLTFTVAAQDVAITGSGTGALAVTANGANDLTIVGGSGNDSIDMLATLETDDSIDGGDGTDTVTVLGDGVTSAADGDITVSNVENLEIDSDTNADNLDFDVFSDASTFDRVIVTSTADADQVTLTDVQSSAYTIRNASTGNVADDLAAVTIDLKTSTGSSTAISVDLANRQLGTAGNQEAFTLGTLTAAGVETLTINTSNVSSAGTAEDITITTLTTAALSTLNINGSADFVVTNALSTTTDVIDASGSTGVVSLTVAGSDVAYTGGTGADTIAFGTSLDGDDSVDGGDGTDTVTATFNAGTVTPANITNVETFSATFGGGALNASGLAGLNKITIASATAAAVISQIGANVATINQRGDGTTLNINYANGADATVAYNNVAATANIANAATSFSNVASLTVSSNNGTVDNRTVALGSLNGGTALTSLTLNTSSDDGDTLNTGNLTAANLETLTIVADEADLTVGTLAAAADLTTLSISNLDAESDANITIGAIGAGTAAASLTSVNITTSGNALTGTTVVDADDIDAGAGTIATFTVNLAGDYGTSDIDRVTAKDIDAITITTDANGTSLAIEDFLLSGSAGDVSITAGAAFDGLTNFIDTSATGAVGNVSISSRGATTIADAANEVFINDALTVGNISLVVTAAAGSINIGEIEEATTIGNLDITGTGNVTFDGAPAATSIGNITASVASGKTVDLNDGSFGAATGVMGTTTVTGAGAFTLAVGAVTTLGNIDLTGMTSTSSSNIALSNTTAIGVVYSGGAGADIFVGTGGGDVITAGEGADNITGGDGADTIDLTETTAATDTVQINDDDAVDSVTGWSATDIIDIDTAAINVELGQNLVDSAGDVTAGDAADFLTLSSGDTVLAAAVAATDNILYFDDVAGLDSFADLTFDVTLDANYGNAGDAMLLVFYDADDGVARVGYATDAGAAVDANMDEATTTFTELVAVAMTTAQYAALTADNFGF